MVALSDIKDWLKSFNLFDFYYVGRLDNKKENALGVYNLVDSGRHEVIGGLKIYDKKGISILIHGNKNKSQTEKKAFDLYNQLERLIVSCDYPKIAGKNVYFIELLQNQPVDVDQDSCKTYEYVIELNIYFEK